jgi:hypothetical protein
VLPLSESVTRVKWGMAQKQEEVYEFDKKLSRRSRLALLLFCLHPGPRPHRPRTSSSAEHCFCILLQACKPARMIVST